MHQDKNIHNIFTYGTLMKGQRNHHYLRDSQYIGDGYVKGYELLEIKDYPGAVLSSDPHEEIWGEVYQVSEEVKREVDILEEGYLYKEVMVEMKETSVLCSFYEFILEKNHSYPKSVVSGKWKPAK